MNSSPISYQVSYFKAGEPSSVDIVLNTQNQEIHGFQIVADIEASPAISLIDQDNQTEGFQLSVANNPYLNFLTNNVSVTEKGYKIVLAAITKNPKQPFSSHQNLPIGRLFFTQTSDGAIIINTNADQTKIPLALGGEDLMAITDSALLEEHSTTEADVPQTISLETKEFGTKLETLGGEIYLPPTLTPNTNQQQLATDLVSPKETDSPFGSLNLLSVVFCVTLILLISLIILKLKKRKKTPQIPLPPETETMGV